MISHKWLGWGHFFLLYSFQNIILFRKFDILEFTIEILFTTFLLDNNLAVSACNNYITSSFSVVPLYPRCTFVYNPGQPYSDSHFGHCLSPFSFQFYVLTLCPHVLPMCIYKNILALSCFIFSICFVSNHYFIDRCTSLSRLVRISNCKE